MWNFWDDLINNITQVDRLKWLIEIGLFTFETSTMKEVLNVVEIHPLLKKLFGALITFVPMMCQFFWKKGNRKLIMFWAFVQC